MRIANEIDLPADERKFIADLVNLYPDETLGFMLSLIRYQFRENIKVAHYMWLAYLIGESVATENNAYKNQLSLCQRQN